MSIDLIQSLRELLEDHRHLNLRDGSNVDYLAGLISEMLDDDQSDDQQLELWGDYGDGHLFKKNSTARKISEHKTDGIEYKERRVKSYGFFKNEYYDD